MKTLKTLVIAFTLTALIPSQIFAQNTEKIICRDEACVNELLQNLSSDDENKVAEAEQALIATAEEAGYWRDSYMVESLKRPIMEYIINNENPGKNAFVISLFPKFCWADDCRDIMKLTDNSAFIDDLIRAVGDINGSGAFIAKYINTHDNTKNRASYAYAIGKQNITQMENTLIAWLKGADDKTKIEIYNALLVVRSSKKTTSIIEKGAKKLNKSDIAENKIAGMRLLVAIKGEKAMPILYKALQSDCRNVRVEALDLMKPFANQEVVENVIKRCKTDIVKIDVVDWLGDIKNDSHMDMIINQLTYKDAEAVNIAIRAIFKIDNAEGIAAVKPMIGGEYQDFIKEAIVNYEGNYGLLMNDVLKNGNDQQKLGALKIVESRPSEQLNTRVKELVYANSLEVRNEAFKVLKLVAIPYNADFLQTLLQTCDEKYVEDVQEAIKVAMKDATDADKDQFASTLKHVRADLMPRFYKVFTYFGTELCVDKLIDAYQNGNYKDEAKQALLLVENESYKQRISEVLK